MARTMRRHASDGTTALLALFAMSTWAAEYSGGQCTGVVDFELKAGAPVAALDAQVGIYMSALPGWIKQECTDAFRTNLCGQLYAPYAMAADADTMFCQSQCLDIAAACEATAGLDPELAMLAPSQQCRNVNDNSDCVAVGALDESLYAEGDCPEPLVLAERNRFKHYDGKIVSVQGTACVVGCPIHETFYGENYLTFLDSLYLGWAAAGTICGTLILANIKPTGRRLYAWMFAFGSLCLNLLSVMFLAFDYHSMLCDGGVGHLRRSSFMTGIGFGIHYCMLFSISWICLQTVSMWKIIHGASPSKIAGWRKYFTPITIFVPLAICTAPLIGQNYGWSVMAMLPFPLMLVEDTKAYFWATFYAPIVILVVAQFVLGANAVYTFYRIIGRNYSSRSNAMNRTKFWNIIRYNSEALVFMTLIGLFTTITAGFVGYQTGYASYEFQDGIEKYIACLLKHAYDDVDCPRTEYYDLSVKYTALEVAYISSYGVIALVAFAPSTTLWKTMLRPGGKSNSSATSYTGNTDHPPTPRGSKAIEMKTMPSKNHLSMLSSSSSEEEARSSGMMDLGSSKEDDADLRASTRGAGLNPTPS